MNRNKAAAFTALNTFANSRVQLIERLKKLGYRTLEECRPVVIEWACNEVGKKAKLEQKDIDAMYRSNKAGTKLMLNSNHKKYEAAKTTVRDMMDNIAGTTRHKKAQANRKEKAKKVRISAEQRAAFEALVLACNGDKARARTVVKALAV